MCARVWDLYLLDGEEALLRAAAALLRLMAPRLISLDADGVLVALTSTPAAGLAAAELRGWAGGGGGGGGGGSDPGGRLWAAIRRTRTPREAAARLRSMAAADGVRGGGRRPAGFSMARSQSAPPPAVLAERAPAAPPADPLARLRGWVTGSPSPSDSQ